MEAHLGCKISLNYWSSSSIPTDGGKCISIATIRKRQMQSFSLSVERDMTCALKSSLMGEQLRQDEMDTTSCKDTLATIEEGTLGQYLFEMVINSIEECRKTKSRAHGLWLHTCICSKGLENHAMLANYFLRMWLEIGNIIEAEKLFSKTMIVDELSWSCMINGYIKFGDLNCAFALYNIMQDCFPHHHLRALHALIQACGKLRDLDMGSIIHAQIVHRRLLNKDSLVGSSLIAMYAKCGSLAKAQEVFDMLCVRDVVVWTSLISAYTLRGCATAALSFYDQMRHEGVPPNAVTYSCILKACGSIAATSKGIEIHKEIAKNGFLEKYQFLGNALVGMYVKFGDLRKAEEVFNGLPTHDVVSWTTIITGFVNHESASEALKWFHQMRLSGIHPDATLFACVLRACGSIRSLEKGREIHAEILRNGMLKGNLLLGNALLDMYSKCGSLDKAYEIFQNLHMRDVVSWNSLINGYVQHENSDEALKCFEQMKQTGILPNDITYACILKACGNISAIDKGMEIHKEISEKGPLSHDRILINALIDMYAKFENLPKAQELFSDLPDHDIVSWNILIAGYVEHGYYERALNCLVQMYVEGFLPDVFTFTSATRACTSVRAVNKGMELHAEIIKRGLLATSLVVSNAVVDMYLKLGLLDEAEETFLDIPHPDVVSWTILIGGYVENELYSEALNCFDHMQVDSIFPNTATVSCCLKAYGSIGAIHKGREMHSHIVARGLLEENSSLSTALVDMYARNGLLTEAQETFDRIQNHDVVSWTALIGGFADHDQEEEAIETFHKMKAEGISPNALTFACGLKSCGNIGTIDSGREMHSDIEKQGLFEKNPIVGSALVAMYAKCGLIIEAQALFDRLSVRDVVAWNALITGYALLGECSEALSIFNRMQSLGSEPDPVTFLSVLNACSHVGLVDDGQLYFEIMTKYYGIPPSLEHYTCMVDLLGRAGQLDLVVLIMINTDFQPSKATWLSILNACRKWGNTELGTWAFEKVLKLDGNNAAAYVSLYNIYNVE